MTDARRSWPWFTPPLIAILALMATALVLTAQPLETAPPEETHPSSLPTASAPTKSTVFTRTFRRGERAFLIASDAEVNRPENGMLMLCPAHAHGTPDKAKAKLRELVAMVPADQRTSIWVCRANTLETLRQFGPMVDQVVINPFVRGESTPTTRPAGVWPGANHPNLNQIRQLRQTLPDGRLVACIDLNGEPSLFQKRQPSFEEVEWMIGAVIGGNFQGVTWRNGGNLDGLFDGRLTRRQKELLACAAALGEARSVDWIEAPVGVSAAALRSGDQLFVVILNGSYMRPGKDGVVSLPLDNERMAGKVRLRLPSGVTAKSATTLAGQAVNLAPGADPTISFSTCAGATFFVVQVAGQPVASRPATTSAPATSER